jgi:precorrin-2 methylase
VNGYDTNKYNMALYSNRQMFTFQDMGMEVKQMENLMTWSNWASDELCYEHWSGETSAFMHWGNSFVYEHFEKVKTKENSPLEFSVSH